MITMNQANVLHNPHQGKAKRVLCVCTAGILRSSTAAHVLAQAYGYNTRCCGAETEIALIPLTEALVDWSDEVVCMDQGHGNAVVEILKTLSIDRPVRVLNVPDIYPRMAETLQELIINSYEEQLDNDYNE